MDTHHDETEAPGALTAPEKEKQVDGLSEGSPPPTSTSVQFIGINHVPDSTEAHTASRPSPVHPIPWESGAASPTSEGHVVIGLPTFPPKPYVFAFFVVAFFAFCLLLPQLPTPLPGGKKKRVSNKLHFFLLLLTQFFSAHISSFCRQVKRRLVPISVHRLGPPPEDSAYFTPPAGQIGVHRPREIVRVERDYTGGEVVQFSSAYPTELEGRVSGFRVPPKRRFYVCCLFLLREKNWPRSRRGSSWRVSTPSTRYSYLLIACGIRCLTTAWRYLACSCRGS